jgi:hypothetical protein
MELGLLSLLAPAAMSGGTLADSRMESGDPEQVFRQLMQQKTVNKEIAATASAATEDAGTTVTLSSSPDMIREIVAPGDAAAVTTLLSAQSQEQMQVEAAGSGLFLSVFPVDIESLMEQMREQLAVLSGDDGALATDAEYAGFADMQGLAELFNPTLAGSLAKQMPDWSAVPELSGSAMMVQMTKVTVSVSMVQSEGADGELNATVTVQTVTETLTLVRVAADEGSDLTDLLKRLITSMPDDEIQADNLLDVTTEEGFSLLKSLMSSGDFTADLQAVVKSFADAASGLPVTDGWQVILPDMDEQSELASMMAVYAEVPWAQPPTVVSSWTKQVTVALREVAGAAQAGEAAGAIGAALQQAADEVKQQLQQLSAEAAPEPETVMDETEFDALVQRVTNGEMKSSSHFVADAFARQMNAQAGQKLMHERLISSMQEEGPESAGSAKEAASVQGLQASSMHSSHLNSPSDRAVSFLKAELPQQEHPATAGEQVSVSIRKALKGGSDHVTVQLDPAELGRVEVRLDIRADGRTHVVVNADNKDTLDQLQRDARLLEKALQDAGLGASAQDMAFNLQSGGKDEGDNPQVAGQAHEEDADAEAGQDMLLTDPLAGHYTLNVEQGLNIKV